MPTAAFMPFRASRRSRPVGRWCGVVAWGPSGPCLGAVWWMTTGRCVPPERTQGQRAARWSTAGARQGAVQSLQEATAEQPGIESDGPERASSRGTEAPLPYQVPQLKPRPGRVASPPAGALSGPPSACVSAGRPAVGRLLAG